MNADLWTAFAITFASTVAIVVLFRFGMMQRFFRLVLRIDTWLDKVIGTDPQDLRLITRYPKVDVYYKVRTTPGKYRKYPIKLKPADPADGEDLLMLDIPDDPAKEYDFVYFCAEHGWDDLIFMPHAGVTIVKKWRIIRRPHNKKPRWEYGILYCYDNK